MPTAKTNRFDVRGKPQLVELEHDLTAAGASEPLRLGAGDVTVQLSGTGTLTAVVERSTRDPVPGNWGPAEDETFDGDLADGIAPRVYVESGVAYWRVRLLTYDAGTVKVSIMGNQP